MIGMLTPWLFALAAAALSADAPSAPVAHLAGRVRAVPRVSTDGAASGGAYASRDASYAVRFDYQHLKNVIVYAEPVASAQQGEARSPQQPESILRIHKDRYGVKISPDFTVAAAQQPLVFRNETKEAVSLDSGGDSPAEISIPLAAGEEKRVALGTIGLYQLSCFLCQKNSTVPHAKVFAAGRYFMVADKDGKYSLDLPAGGYTVTAWHERLPEHTETITLKPGEKHELDFSLSVRELPQVP